MAVETRCSACERPPTKTGMRLGMCIACYKRLVWRPRNGDAVERDREASRRWKREHLGQPGRKAT